MPLRRAVPLQFAPSTVTDSVDGTGAPPGSMKALINLVPDPTTPGVFVPRPAVMPKTLFPSLSAPGFVSAQLVVGDIVYGLVASQDNPGFDHPFSYNLATGVFAVVQGIKPGNIPVSPPTSGPWTPPFMAVVGSRVIVTHPGFPGGATKFGWFDISSFTETTTGTLTNGQNTVAGNPAIAGVQPGMTIAGTNVPAGTTVVSTQPFTLTTTASTQDGLLIDGIPSSLDIMANWTVTGPGIPAGAKVYSVPGRHSVIIDKAATATAQAVALNFNSGAVVTTGNTYASGTLSNVAKLTGVAVGQNVAGLGIPAGTTVSNVNTVTNVVILSNALLGDGFNNVSITFSGSVLVMSANATGSGSVTLTIAGGSVNSPLWGAGDCDINPLPSIPVGVAQFFGRAYFALGTNGIVYSDPGFPCRVSNATAVQALTTNDGLAVTALYPLMLASPLITTGLIQALCVFQGAAKIQQITGDAAFGTLNMAPIPVATGTQAPLSIFSCEKGTGFVSNEGLRFIKFDGAISEPVGNAGRGVTVPFIFSAQPSRIVASANAHVVRISTINGLLPQSPTPYQEFWWDIGREIWTGPHTFPVSLISPWRDTFVVSQPDTLGTGLFQSDVFSGLTSSYVENGMNMAVLFATTPMPDAGDGAEHALVDMTWSMQLPAGDTMAVSAFDISGELLDMTTVLSPVRGSLWDSAIWDQSLWDSAAASYQQLDVEWNGPLTFKQLVLQFGGQSSNLLRLGPGYMKFEVLGYRLQVA